MSWINFDTDPPSPMGMEDGEPTPLWKAQALKCSECNQWYFRYQGESELSCSPGCAMVRGERLAREKS